MPPYTDKFFFHSTNRRSTRTYINIQQFCMRPVVHKVIKLVMAEEFSIQLDSPSPYVYPGSIVSGKVCAVFQFRRNFYKTLSLGVHGFLKQPRRIFPYSGGPDGGVVSIHCKETETGIFEETETVIWNKETHAPLQQNERYEFPFQIRIPLATAASCKYSCINQHRYKYTMSYIVKFGFNQRHVGMAKHALCETPLHIVQHIDLSTPLLRQPVETRQVIRRRSFLCIPMVTPPHHQLPVSTSHHLVKQFSKHKNSLAQIVHKVIRLLKLFPTCTLNLHLLTKKPYT